MQRSSGRTNAQLNLLTTAECNGAITTNAHAIHTRYDVKIERFADEISDLRHRFLNLPENNLNDSDILEIQEDIDDIDSDIELEILCPRPRPFKSESANDGLNEISVLDGNNISAENSDTSDISNTNHRQLQLNGNDLEFDSTVSTNENQHVHANSNENLTTLVDSTEKNESLASSEINLMIDTMDENQHQQTESNQNIIVSQITNENDAAKENACAQQNNSKQPIDNVGDLSRDLYDDDLSGGMLFTQNEMGDRFFENSNVVIRFAVVQLLTTWNTTAPFSQMVYDRLFVNILLKEVFGDELCNDNLNETTKSFVMDLFAVRVKNEAGRLKYFDEYVAKKREKAVAKKNH